MASSFAMKNGAAFSSQARYQGSSSAVTNDAMLTRDAQEMARLGKRQELRRNFGFISILSFSCTLMITWAGLFPVFTYGLTDGGPAGLIYGYLFCWIGWVAIIASLAEMVSMAPISSGQYHWTFIFAPKSSRIFLSWITGWQSFLSWQACLTSGAYLGGTMIQGLLVLNCPTYNFQRWHGTLLLYAVALFALLFNTYLAKALPKVEGAVFILYVVGFFSVLITLIYLAPHSTPSEVFSQYLTLGGYGKGPSFFVGLTTSIYAFIGADGGVHMSEETQNASTVVPRAMLASVGLNGLMGLVTLITLLFSIGDIQSALQSPTGFPFIEIFRQATKSDAGATAMTAVVLALVIFATIAVLAATSRITWAFARDNGLPGSFYLTQVEPHTKLPLYAIALSVTITLLLGLINIGSSAAFNAVASLVISGFLGSFTIPIALLLRNRITKQSSIHYGPFRLGRYGIACNSFALVWIIVVTIFSFFPVIRTGLSLQTMNWSCLLWAGSMVIGIVSYFSYIRGRYTGPVVATDEEGE